MTRVIKAEETLLDVAEGPAGRGSWHRGDPGGGVMTAAADRRRASPRVDPGDGCAGCCLLRPDPVDRPLPPRCNTQGER